MAFDCYCYLSPPLPYPLLGGVAVGRGGSEGYAQRGVGGCRGGLLPLLLTSHSSVDFS
jgi:hypothetical protein